MAKYISRNNTESHANSSITNIMPWTGKDAIRHDVIRHSKPFMRELLSLSKEAMLVLLTDHKGCIVEVVEEDRLGEINFTQKPKIGTKINAYPNIKCPPFTILSAPIALEAQTLGNINLICHIGCVDNRTQSMVKVVANAISAILDMKNKKDKLYRENQKREAIVNSITDGLLTVDQDGYLTFINDVGELALDAVEFE